LLVTSSAGEDPTPRTVGSKSRAFAFRPLIDRLFGPDIFISYSRRDRDWAEAIEKLLKSGRYRVFRDQSELRVGEKITRLLNEVRRSTMLVLLVSEHSMASDWVHDELSAYLDRPVRRRRIAPVFIDPRYPAELPARFQILRERRQGTGACGGVSRRPVARRGRH
jgi:hypothetical protein